MLPAPASMGAGARFKEKRNTPSALDGARERLRVLLGRIAAEIRRRQYSIRTEQAYEAWMCRLILFCGNRDPAKERPLNCRRLYSVRPRARS